MTGRPRAGSFLPPPPQDLRTYAGRMLARGHVVFRAHHQGHEPGYFASVPPNPDDGGRFDLPRPEGTCYVAKDALVALRERFGPELMDHGEVPISAVQEARVSRLRLQKPVMLADTAAERAGNFHNLELVTSPDYARTQQWAQALRKRGFDGVMYQARFTTRDTAAAIALFGEAGPVDWPAVGKEDVVELMREAGMKVTTRRPARSVFTKARPPHS